MMAVMEDMRFLECIKDMLDEKIKSQKELIKAERAAFFDNDMDYELSRELHRYERWRDEIETYIVNRRALGGILK